MRVVAALVAVVGVAHALEWRPSWSFEQSAKYLMARAPGAYGAALREVSGCVRCGAYSVAPRRLTLENVTLVLNGTEALRVDRLQVDCAATWKVWRPLVVGVRVDTVRVYVEARDVWLRDTNWHAVAALERALGALSSPAAPDGRAPASGVDRLEFAGNVSLELRPPPILGGADASLVATLNWEEVFAPASAAVAARAAESGALTVDALFAAFREEILAAAARALARAVEDPATALGDATLSLAGVALDARRPRATLDALRAAAGDRLRSFVRNRGLDAGEADLVLGAADDAADALAAALRRAGLAF